ncbi:MAG: hypothetical protein ACI86H_001752 [bacterium]|jgi:hypothetical protein
MANVQNYFEKFHEDIKLKRMKENKPLKEKRDIILKKLRDKLKEQFEKKEEKMPKFEHFNQGSYGMNTGIKPATGSDYDIDVGLLFHINKDDYPDPIQVKKWVYDALNGHTDKVELKEPCITVTYTKQGEDAFHVDLVIYVHPDENDVKIYHARGKSGSKSENKKWELCEPKKFIKDVENHYNDSDDSAQFRRIIRYLKQWKNEKFPSNGNSAPIGIGLTGAALKYFQCEYSDVFTKDYDDLKALINFIQKMINNFSYSNYNNEFAERLVVKFSVEPYDDLFDRMSNKQMQSFKSKLESLLEALQMAQSEADLQESCKIIKKNLSDKFHVPSKIETEKKEERGFSSSNQSA